MSNNIVLENECAKLIIRDDCTVESLFCKETGEECLHPFYKMPFFSVTQERPYNNEIKLIHPNKQTIFQGNRIYQEGNSLIIGFEVIPYEAVVEVIKKPSYMVFSLKKFRISDTDYPNLAMTAPPVFRFRLVQLPVKERKYFGEWLNVCWDEKSAVNVSAVSPFTVADWEKRTEGRVLSADVLKEYQLLNTPAAVICTSSRHFLDAVQCMEEDYHLPQGVKSRRSDAVHRSIYWYGNITPENVQEHISFAEQCGLKQMLLYYTCMFREEKGYSLCGNYDYRKEYPNGAEDVRNMLNKIKAAGITPGIHFLHSHIGCKSRYITPSADARLHLKNHFTLAEPLSVQDETVYVEQNPSGSEMHEKCRILNFNGELIYYTGYKTTRPYCFTGCVRGYWNTDIRNHGRGSRGGILDVSEFGGTSCYIDEKTSLQDEIADKLAEVYNAGFEFIYFDGSEGTNPPFEVEVPRGQYRVYKKLKNPPLFAEGAAKAHFNWHLLSGGNAFDVFSTAVFKEMIKKYPAEGAKLISQDFTGINFGWWAYYEDTQPDVYEYGESRSLAWDCPVTVMANPEIFKKNSRTKDNLEVIRRWEEVREKKLLTKEQKESLKNTDQEHILLINEESQYELCPYDAIEVNLPQLSAFLFERRNKRYAVYWRKKGSSIVSLPALQSMQLMEELNGKSLSFEKETPNSVLLPADGRRYIMTVSSAQEIREAFKKAKEIDIKE